MKPIIEDCAIDEIVEAAIASTRQVANAAVSFDYKPFSKGVVVSSDSHILQKILVKILDNAAKFTKSGGGITVLTRQAQNGISIIVEDTGPGIPADKAETVFEQFTKLDEFSQGTGMGLTLCRTIIQKLNGRIYVDTSYSGGCRMVIEIPEQ